MLKLWHAQKRSSRQLAFCNNHLCQRWLLPPLLSEVVLTFTPSMCRPVRLTGMSVSHTGYSSLPTDASFKHCSWLSLLAPASTAPSSHPRLSDARDSSVSCTSWHPVMLHSPKH
jgi:hypothetical protein